MKIFGSLRKMREFEKAQLPFIGSLADFDIVIEIGEAQEKRRPFSPKQLFLLNVGALSTVRRRLRTLTAKGIIVRKTNPKDRRSELLTVAPAVIRQLERYASLLATLG